MKKIKNNFKVGDLVKFPKVTRNLIKKYQTNGIGWAIDMNECSELYGIVIDVNDINWPDRVYIENKWPLNNREFFWCKKDLTKIKEKK